MSSNVEDRRGLSGGAKAGIGGGILAVIIGIVMSLLGGGGGGAGGGIDLGQVIGAITQGGGGLGDILGGRQAEATYEGETDPTQFTPEEQRLDTVCRIILASTEDVWTKVFKENNLGTYANPTLVLFTNSVQSACGTAPSSVGPFYCSGDQKLYIDLSFFTQMEKQLGAPGDFARAYVIAHEVGHHVENLLGSLGQAHAQMNRQSKTEANKTSVRLELLADYYAGVWAHYEDEAFGSLEQGDLQEAIKCAHQIGDNYLQKTQQGYVVPESFTHGTSEQRMKWLKLGYDTGNMNTTTFNVAESQL